MLTSCVSDATISVMCRNDDKLLHMANVEKVYYTEEEYRELTNETCSFMNLVFHNSTYVLEYTKENKKKFVPNEFWLTIDVSGSMNERVLHYQVEEKCNDITKPIDTHPYVEIKFSISSINENTHIVGCGNVISSSISYMDTLTKTIKTEHIKVVEIENNHVMEHVHTFMMLSDKLNKPISDIEIKELYKNHLYISQLLKSDTLPTWLQAQGKVLWKNIRQRFMSTLSLGEQFFHQTPISYNLMLRASSSEMSTQSATPYATGSVSINENIDIDKCKLCYEEQINVLFPECRHAGLCKSCYITYRDTGKTDCPFCRMNVSSWSYINVDTKKNGYCQQDYCYKYCDYVGYLVSEDTSELCGHLLYCKSCKNKNKKENGIMCKECNHVVKPILIHFC